VAEASGAIQRLKKVPTDMMSGCPTRQSLALTYNSGRPRAFAELLCPKAQSGPAFGRPVFRAFSTYAPPRHSRSRFGRAELIISQPCPFGENAGKRTAERRTLP
jgi:hypothetical protein